MTADDLLRRTQRYLQKTDAVNVLAEGPPFNKSDYEIKRIPYQDTKPFILNIHYAHRMPSVSYAYGLFRNAELVGVITYGMPASNTLCKGICGEEWKKNVIELNRLVLKDNLKNEASYLISGSLKLLDAPKIVVSYADSAQNHSGFVYRATNFLFTGTTKPRTDMASANGKHSRHHAGDRSNRVERSAKHRYVTFVGDKRQKKLMMASLKYTVLPYPKIDAHALRSMGKIEVVNEHSR